MKLFIAAAGFVSLVLCLGGCDLHVVRSKLPSVSDNHFVAPGGPDQMGDATNRPAGSGVIYVGLDPIDTLTSFTPGSPEAFGQHHQPDVL